MKTLEEITWGLLTSPANLNVVFVGNSKGLLGKGLGDRINSFDMVVRFNNYEIAGYEEDVGDKTHCLARRSCDDVKLHPGGNFLKIVNFITYGRHTEGMKIVARNLTGYYKDKLLNVSEIECATLGRDMELDQPHNEWASIGALAIGWFCNKFPNNKYAACGFDFLRTDSHYFKLKPKDSQFHNSDKEEKYLRSLPVEFF